MRLCRCKLEHTLLRLAAQASLYMVISHFDFHDSELLRTWGQWLNVVCNSPLCWIVSTVRCCWPAQGPGLTAWTILSELQVKSKLKLPTLMKSARQHQQRKSHLQRWKVVAAMIISDGRSCFHDQHHNVFLKIFPITWQSRSIICHQQAVLVYELFYQRKVKKSFEKMISPEKSLTAVNKGFQSTGTELISLSIHFSIVCFWQLMDLLDDAPFQSRLEQKEVNCHHH